MRKEEPIRVLQCVSNMNRAGIETMLMNYYRNIDLSKIQFDFIVNKDEEGDYAEEIRKMGGKIYVSPGLNPLKWFKYQKFMNDLFKTNPNYKIIHCQNEAMGFPALFAAKKNNIPIRISHSHNTTTRIDFKWPIKILYKYLLRKNANILVACSKAAGKYLFGKDVEVINNAIDSEKFIFNAEKRKKIREMYNVKEKFVIGHVGRFEPQKNHEFLIDMFFEYLKVNNNSILMLIGDGSLKNKIEDKVKKLGIVDQVIFVGNIPNVNDYYQAMDLFVLPSFHEGLPVVGVEAQASGLKCLLSNKITEETDITGNVVFLPIDNTKEWINEIEKNNSYKRENLKKVLIEKNFDIKSGAKKIEKMYLNLYQNK